MTPADAGQLAVKLVFAAVLLYGYVKLVLWIALRLHEAGKRAQETDRLRQLLILADAYEVAPTEADRKNIYKKAEGLGFTEDAFALDDYDLPHKPAA